MNPLISKEGLAAKNRIKQFRQNVNNGATSKEARANLRQIQAGPVNTGIVIPPPITPGTPAISASTLGGVTPMFLTSPSPATQAQGMMAEFQDATDTFTQDLQDQATALEAPKTNALSAYISQLESAQGVGGLTNDAYAEQGGVNDITPELNDINDKIRREQLSMRRRTEAIQQNGGGLASGASAEIQNIERDSFARLADLAVIQMAVQGRYDSAKEIADRAVTAKLEQQTNDLATLKFNYEENKDLFTKAEQRAFEAASGDRERKLEEEADNKKSIYDLGLQASADGAPSSVVSQMLKAKTREEALALGGNYIGALDRAAKQASIANTYAQIEERKNKGNEFGTVNGKAQTATQATANGFANRLTDANRIFSTIGDKFAGNLSYGNLLPNQLQSAERQQFEQAKRNFVNAVLRRESGAVISPSEFDNAAIQYFAQPGDTPDVLLQKAQNRNTVINNLYNEANTFRPVVAGDVIVSDGLTYRVGEDGQTITPVE